MDAIVPELLRGGREVGTEGFGVKLTQKRHIRHAEDLEELFELDVQNGHFLELGKSDLAEVEVHSGHLGAFDDVVESIAPC